MTGEVYTGYLWAAYGVAVAVYGGLLLLWNWQSRSMERRVQELSAATSPDGERP
jgi:heme exporter protein CcmD